MYVIKIQKVSDISKKNIKMFTNVFINHLNFFYSRILTLGDEGQCMSKNMKEMNGKTRADS